jgi:hypothetical protein
MLWEHEVVGSNPTAPTIPSNRISVPAARGHVDAIARPAFDIPL